jgi:hypothetical protein
MARCGLRMMPPFPSSPLSAVRRVFPSTAARLACQAGPFQHVDQLKPAPGMHCSTSGLSSPFVHLVANIGYPVLSRAAGSIVHHHEAEYSATPEVLAPVRVMLSRSIITYRPHPPRSQAHRNFTARRLICDAFAVRECLGDPRAVPGFCWPIFPDMPSPTTPGSSTSISSRYRRRHRPSPKEQRLGTPNVPAIRFARGEDFVASTVRIFATACQVARHPVRI